MEKLYVDDFLDESIKNTLKKVGITDDVFSVASKMNVDLIDLFYDKVIVNNSAQNQEVVTKSLLGIYGNFIATTYFSSLGYEVKNEVPVSDKTGKIATYADLAFVDKAGKINYCEVKMTKQVLGDERTYRDQESLFSFNRKSEDVIKYTQIGKKLLTQVRKLASANGLVNVIFFEGCYVDDIIKEKLSRLKVNVITLFPNVIELERSIKDMVESFSSLYQANLINASRNK